MSVRVFFLKTRECLPESDSEQSACRYRPRPHRDSGRSSNDFPKPRPSCRAHGVSYARGELSAPRRRDSRLRSPKWDDANQGSHDFLCSFFFGLCVNVCGWRQSGRSSIVLSVAVCRFCSRISLLLAYCTVIVYTCHFSALLFIATWLL